MLFKTGQVEEEWRSGKLHPDLTATVTALDKFCAEHQLPEVIITSLMSGKHRPGSDHYDGRAADIRAHRQRYDAEQITSMSNFILMNHWRKTTNSFGRQLLAFYPHGTGDNFHIHLSVDK